MCTWPWPQPCCVTSCHPAPGTTTAGTRMAPCPCRAALLRGGLAGAALLREVPVLCPAGGLGHVPPAAVAEGQQGLAGLLRARPEPGQSKSHGQGQGHRWDASAIGRGLASAQGRAWAWRGLEPGAHGQLPVAQGRGPGGPP